jgi:hypothetical protein
MWIHKFGYSYTEYGKPHCRDFCIIDVVPTLPCDWIWHDGTSIYHIEEFRKINPNV